MRRYLPTLILIAGLLVIGGMALFRTTADAAPSQGYYVPTLSSDPQTGQMQGLLLVGSIAAILVLTVGMGIGLAIAFGQLSKMYAVHQPDEAAPSRSAPKPAGAAPEVLLSDNRSLVVFWIAVVVLSLAFLVLQYWGRPLGYLPLAEIANMPLFRLPGEHIEGLPPFIAGPGDMVTALHLFIAVVGGAVVTTMVLGVGLARGFAVLDESARSADAFPRTRADALIAAIDARLRDLRTPKPRAARTPRTPPSFIDLGFMALNGLLLLVVVGIVVAWTIPSLRAVSEVDRAVEATRMAAFVTPVAPGASGPTTAEALQAELAALPVGEAARGPQVFSTAGCEACHSREPEVVMTGPSLAGMASRAGSRQPGFSAELYLYASITRPNEYVVQGFQPNIMPATFRSTLKPQDLADVIAYLMTLE